MKITIEPEPGDELKEPIVVTGIIDISACGLHMRAAGVSEFNVNQVNPNDWCRLFGQLAAQQQRVKDTAKTWALAHSTSE